METISAFFEKDHREIDEILAGVPFDAPTKAVEVFSRFDEHLERHIRWEEEILFPPVASRNPMLEFGPLRVMKMEHEEIRRRKALAFDALRRGDGESAGTHAEAMMETLKAHNAKEEHVLYPACDALLSPDEARKILDKVRSAAGLKSLA